MSVFIQIYIYKNNQINYCRFTALKYYHFYTYNKKTVGILTRPFAYYLARNFFSIFIPL